MGASKNIRERGSCHGFSPISASASRPAGANWGAPNPCHPLSNISFYNDDKKMGSSAERGQAAMEFIFVVPLLFMLMLWTFQFFYAIHTSSMNQKFAREELMFQVSNYRDLRNSSNTPREAYINDGFWNISGTDYLNYQSYLNRYSNQKSYFAVDVNRTPGGFDRPQRLVGEPGGTKGTIIEVETKVGICRDERCK
ncbi:MAG: pilus assembly protein [Deltaproteobacteria bacterium]|nr:pilus assembly protein [Deltaproteobacteria bacterium]